MTPQQLRALKQLETAADRLSPQLRAAYLKAVRRLVLGADVDKAAAALARNDLAGAVNALLPPDSTRQFAHDLTVAVANVMGDAGPSSAKEIASIIRLDFRFVPGAPAMADALQGITARLIGPLVADMLTGLQRVLTDGLALGQNPRVVARLARGFVSLTDYDASLVLSFVEQLRNDPSRALTRALRDARFDRTVARSIEGQALTDEQIATMEQAYVRQLTAWRAETWSRTATLQTLRETQHANWLTAADTMGVGRDRIVRTWITTLDGRERPAHHAQHGDTVPIDQSYSNGDVYVGESSPWNCRCTETIRVLPANGARAAEFLAQRRAQFAEARATSGRQPKRRVA